MKRLVSAPSRLLDPQLQAHLLRDQYGTFRLTRAIRPGLDLEIIPQAGYRLELQQRPAPRLAASISAERLFDVFLDLLSLLGETVDVHVQSSHGNGRCHFVRRGLDRPVLMSYCVEFEELLLHDGCTGIVVIDPAQNQEVHFDEHKVIIIYSWGWEQFAQIFEQYGILRCDDLKLILEAVHYHCSRPEYAERLKRFIHYLGAEAISGTVEDV
ncbi:MAG: hypothetical protein RMI91_08560 [Gemmatales bacterium]|nr:hypothetical protein [Gemmatales bacterium]MDW7994692.1 hypothetical protein [Gemmatales bacterium]